MDAPETAYAIRKSLFSVLRISGLRRFQSGDLLERTACSMVRGDFPELLPSPRAEGPVVGSGH